MAGWREGANEPPSSLEAIYNKVIHFEKYKGKRLLTDVGRGEQEIDVCEGIEMRGAGSTLGRDLSASYTWRTVSILSSPTARHRSRVIQ
ncbi:hypothetical protein ANN_02791 [Periplaneta americana]|uniref:Uncharacterized protein n=1 Tax=Periplaneta americana TaxID=6978 RepID=A0ABQ8TXA8_PERAM|nr:hypothetical protein ANN_02791 [Periplaneta americana]